MGSTRADLAREARAFQRDAAANNFPFRPYVSQSEWQVLAEGPQLISLSKAFYEYSGGAHGISGREGLVWGKAAGRPVPTLDLFTTPTALEAAIRSDYCAALDAERSSRRGADYRPGAGDPFAACPPLAELTVLPEARGAGRIDRLTLHAGPYVAGPYAEGAYDITLPVTAAVLATVKPAYRAAFAPPR